ncbi:hypothetical protein AAZX31_18G256000 [Glycine max]
MLKHRPYYLVIKKTINPAAGQYQLTHIIPSLFGSHSRRSRRCRRCTRRCSLFDLPLADTEKVKSLTMVEVSGSKTCGTLALSGG